MKTNKHAKYLALAIATGLLGLNFWAWSFVSPLATAYAEQFGLTPVSVSLLVAVPVLVGSVARIPFGLLADRYGGRAMFAAVCLLTATAVLFLAAVDSYSMLLAAALALGVAGASFAVGVPFVNSWFTKDERGFALGVYAIGNAGAAVSGLLTPRLADAMGREVFFCAMAVLLLAVGLAMGIYGRNAPGWKPAKGSAFGRLGHAFAWKLTWRLSLLYAVTFGAFIALGLYLPVLLHQSYELSPVDAATRAAGFVLLATFTRPIGGWLGDKLGGVVVIRMTFLTIAVLAFVAALQPPLMPVGTIVYLGMAATLGVGNGAMFAIIGRRCDTKLVGAVTGIVGAAGGLGGFFPPLIMGVSYQAFQSYTAALGMLAAVAVVIFLWSRRLLQD